MILVTLFSAAFAAAITWDNVAYFDFNETAGTNLTDQTVNNLYGTTINMEDADWIRGLLGNASLFDGVDERIDLQDAPEYNWTTITAGTISVWVNVSANLDTSVQRTIYAFGGSSYITAAIVNSKWQFDYLANDSTSYSLTFPVCAACLGTWTHLVMTYDVDGNHSLYVNGTLVNTTALAGNSPKHGSSELGLMSIGSQERNQRYWNGSIDEMGLWNRSLPAAEISQLYNSGSGVVYEETVGVSIILTAPIDDVVLSDVGVNFTAEYSVSAVYNLTNATYWLWNSTGIFNNSAIVEITGTTNTTTEYIDAFVLGDYEWNVYLCYGNASISNCTFAESNYSFFVGASVDNEVYENITYETSYETFLVNITLIAGTTLYDAQVYYNGIAHDGIVVDSGAGGFVLDSSFDVPATTDNYDWYWRLTYEKSDGTFIFQNLDTNSQAVIAISLFSSGCAATEDTTLNFTAYDEGNLTQINNFSFYGTFEYWLGIGDERKNISISNADVGSELLMCITPNNLTYYSDTIIQYEKPEFIKRNYYLINSSLTNTTNNIGLYLLNSTFSTSFIINIMDEAQFAVADAYIYIQRYYPGTGATHTVEMARTDASGNSIGHFEAETEDYKVIILKDGVVIYESEIQKVYCGESPCTLSFQIEAEAPTVWRAIGDLPNLVWSLVYNEDTKIWTYTYVDVSGTTNYGRLLVYTEDGRRRTIICNVTDESSAATLTCNVTGYDGTLHAEVYISRSPEILVWLESIVERLAKEIFGMEGLFWATIILLVIGLVGLWSPPIGIMMMIAGVVLINFLQLASLGTVTIMGIVVIGMILLWGMRKQ